MPNKRMSYSTSNFYRIGRTVIVARIGKREIQMELLSNLRIGGERLQMRAIIPDVVVVESYVPYKVACDRMLLAPFGSVQYMLVSFPDIFGMDNDAIRCLYHDLASRGEAAKIKAHDENFESGKKNHYLIAYMGHEYLPYCLAPLELDFAINPGQQGLIWVVTD